LSAILNIVRRQQNQPIVSVKHYGFNSAFFVQSQTPKFKSGVRKSKSLFLVKYFSFPEGWLTHQHLDSRRGDTKNTAIDLILYLPLHSIQRQQDTMQHRKHTEVAAWSWRIFASH